MNVSLRPGSLLVVLVVGLLLPSTSQAQCELAKFFSSDTGFGRSVSLTSQWAVVGAPGSVIDNTPGSCHVFAFNGRSWNPGVRLVAADAVDSNQFGTAVAALPSWIFAGASRDSELAPIAGAVYVFQLVGGVWTEVDKLTALGGSAQDRFGSAVAARDDILVVGNPRDDAACPGCDSGAAHVFRLEQGVWLEEQKLVAVDAMPDARLGSAVAVADGIVVLGAPEDSTSLFEAGSVYVFRNVGGIWAQEQKLTASDASDGALFGTAVAATSTRIVVGAPEQDSAGAAYVFEFDGTSWNETEKLTAQDGASGDVFGRSVTVSSAGIGVGAPAEDNDMSSGAVYLYAEDGMGTLQETKLSVQEILTADVASSVAMTDERVLLGVDPFGDTSAAYVLALPQGSDCDGNSIADLCQIENDTTLDCDRDAVLDSCSLANSGDCDQNGSFDGCDLLESTELLFADFEAGLPAGWMTTGIGHVTASCGQPAPCSAAGWIYFGLDATCNFDVVGTAEGALIAPTIMIPSDAATVDLEFCSVYGGECGSITSGFDLALVYVNGELVDDVGRDCTSMSWTERRVDLFPFRGESVEIRFEFTSVDGQNNGGLGWQVDDVRLVTTQVDPVQDSNSNGVLDLCESFQRGECNQDGNIDLSDIVFVLGYLFDPTNTEALPCADACDVNDDGKVDVADPVWLAASLFDSGPLPPSPHPDCGLDPSSDALDCTTPCVP